MIDGCVCGGNHDKLGLMSKKKEKFHKKQTFLTMAKVYNIILHITTFKTFIPIKFHYFLFNNENIYKIYFY